MFRFEARRSDSAYVDVFWRNHCEPGGPFVSVATNYWALVVAHVNGTMRLTLRGPETRATMAECPPEAQHWGICFKVGAYMPKFAPLEFRDGALTLPEHTQRSFMLGGQSWEFPTYENLDVFIDRLKRAGLLARDPVVASALVGRQPDVSPRSVERKFVRATGLTRGAVAQIARARYAAMLLRNQVPIAEVVVDAGYADQPHLTRSLKRYVGQTPAQLLRPRQPTQLSLLFKTQIPF